MFQGIYKSAVKMPDTNTNYIFGTGSIPINIKVANLETFADGTTKQQGYQVAEVNKLISTMLTGWSSNGNKPKSMSDNYLELILSCGNGVVVKKRLQFPHIIAWQDDSTPYNIADVYKQFSIDNWLKADDFENPDITLVVEPTDEILTTSTANPPEATTTNSGRFYLYYRNLPVGINRVHIEFHIKTKTEPIDFDLEVIDGLSWKDAQTILASNEQAKINVLLSTAKDVYNFTGAEGDFENITMHEWSALYQQIISSNPNNKFTHDLFFVLYESEIDTKIAELEENVNKHPEEANDEENIFSICDMNGEIIAKFNSSIRIESALEVDKNGVIKTGDFDSSYTTSAARARFPRINFKKSPLKILDIGNSHSLCSEAYLGVILESQGVNIDDIAFCCISRGAASFKSFYQGWHDQDTSGEGDNLTGGSYLVNKQFGGLDIKVSGNTYISNGDGTFAFDKKVENQSLTSNMLTCWGGDTSLIRDLMTKNQFDIILIHGQDGYLEYEDSNRWRDHSDFGYMTELIRLIKTYQPSATLTYLYPLIYFNYYHKYKTLEQMDECHKIWCRSLRKYMADSGVEYVIPSGTALLNLRHSSCLSVIDYTEIEDSTSGTPIMRPFESASDFAGGVANYETRFGLHYDDAHTAWGIAGYTMSCAIYEYLFAPRFDKSILGNSLREEFKYLNYGGRNHLYLQPMKKDAEGNMIPCTTYNTFSAELGWDNGRRPTIRVTDANAEICQMAAILAVSDIWGINNPDGVTI